MQRTKCTIHLSAASWCSDPGTSASSTTPALKIGKTHGINTTMENPGMDMREPFLASIHPFIIAPCVHELMLALSRSA